ncbi:MAG: 50S ribosomal protein L11 methyltransferase, partial [Candidatus Nanohaloarchaea archaeon]
MTVYQPAEDTFLLKEHVEKLELEGEKVLEIGTGSGIIAVTAAEKGAKVVATDVNPDALEAAEKLAAEEGVEESMDFVES